MFDGPCGEPDGEVKLVVNGPCSVGEAVLNDPCGVGEAVLNDPCGVGEAVLNDPCGVRRPVPGVITKYVWTCIYRIIM